MTASAKLRLSEVKSMNEQIESIIQLLLLIGKYHFPFLLFRSLHVVVSFSLLHTVSVCHIFEGN